MAPVDTSFLNPIFRGLVAAYPEAIDFDKMTIQQARVGGSEAMQTNIETPLVDIEKIEIPDQTDGHSINVTLYKPKDIPVDAQLPVFVYL